MFPEWSPCGNYLSVVERSTYIGRHSFAAVHLFHLDKARGTLRLLDNVHIEVDNFSISNRLWNGAGQLLLPHPLGNGEPPTVVRLNPQTESVTLALPRSSESSPSGMYQQYQQHPSGALTGLTSGHSAFVRYCYLNKRLPMNQHYLGEHEHQIITVLDLQQEHLFEIAIPGIVLEMTSKNNVLCVLYRKHVAVSFKQTEPVIVENAEPRRPQWQDCKTFDPFSTINVTPKRLLYRSYPALDQPWVRLRIPPTKHRHPPECPLEMSATKEVFSFTRLISNPSDSSSESENESESDARNKAQKKFRTLSPPPISAYCTDERADAIDDEVYAASATSIDYKSLQLFYAEINVETKKIIFFRGDVYNQLSPWAIFDGPAFEGYDTTAAGGLNKMVVLNQQGYASNMTVSNIGVHIKRNPVQEKQTQGCFLSRIHKALPSLEDTSRQFVHLDNSHWLGLFAESKHFLLYDRHNDLTISSVNVGQDFDKKSTKLQGPPPPIAYSFVLATNVS